MRRHDSTNPPPGIDEYETGYAFDIKSESLPIAMMRSGLNSAILVADRLMILCTSLYVTRTCFGSVAMSDANIDY